MYFDAHRFINSWCTTAKDKFYLQQLYHMKKNILPCMQFDEDRAFQIRVVGLFSAAAEPRPGVWFSHYVYNNNKV